VYTDSVISPSPISTQTDPFGNIINEEHKGYNKDKIKRKSRSSDSWSEPYDISRDPKLSLGSSSKKDRKLPKVKSSSNKTYFE
jgi:hypothetical protein